MRKILFCNIAWMKRYEGVSKDDVPQNGGRWVDENQSANEEFNFRPISIEGEDEDYYFGSVETKSTNGKESNQLHIEKINGSNISINTESINEVLVVWCAKSDCNDFTSIVGWYKDATVYRDYLTLELKDEDEQVYNVEAKAKDCVLLPLRLRNRRTMWYVPRKGKKNSPSYGFGQSNVWYANDFESNVHLKSYLEKIIDQIDNYSDENMLLIGE
ncbi:MAG: hypothetical protein ACRC7N_11945 [Clostridium sp.]